MLILFCIFGQTYAAIIILSEKQSAPSCFIKDNGCWRIYHRLRNKLNGLEIVLL